MKIIKKVPSWDKRKNIDCFGYGNPHTIDHIYPIAKGGSNAKINKQSISLEANKQKADKTKGKIGSSWRFAILLKKEKEGNIICGQMYIRKKDWPTDEWYEVEPIII